MLYEQMPRYLFPNIILTSTTEELHTLKFYDSFNNELLVREYGQSEDQCIVFFPGRHGGIKKYEETLFRAFQNNNFKVFSISYSGQDGAIGRVDNIASLIRLITDAMTTISLNCPPEKTIVYGRSLGATVAAHSIEENKVSGLIIEAVAPSLSVAVNNYLNSKWYLSPLRILPIEHLLSKDYDLSEPLSLLKAIPVSIFQGTKDSQTPLSQLQQNWSYGGNVSLHIVNNGGHSNTYIQATNEIVKVANSMLVHP
ncbi:alpha/beta hydrolase [Colwellia sp. 4_MG-2023]|uniref:alpha/beta hydrolase n=1 Tax=unclassified Colwellia TaxID=196834 RepID=UPI0026E48194|nr:MULTISPECIES: alpha/beta hydrolase [unclassified Colwellia]MDO6489250.1 alpha/beta hydrolase [Colwellia sp. 6_MG-2023]MDO6508562.1 alpha/beta hydrolase [Colwellia sp. 5_MG-2023]MDO6557222.1 alpha/beta hydrolase [Colwellia sp. 4_MG-2023]